MPFDEAEGEWKIPVVNKDGMNAGYIVLESLTGPDIRTWQSRPQAKHFEVLLEQDNLPGVDPRYFLIFRHGSNAKFELTDADYGRILTTTEAARWLEKEGFDLTEPLQNTLPTATQVDQAFGAARELIDNLNTLAFHARTYQPQGENPDKWKDLAGVFAWGFIAWFDLTNLLTPAVRRATRQVYSAGSPAIKIGKIKAMPTVIETIANELGLYFRNSVYRARSHPFEPDRSQLSQEAMARATARQVALGKPPIPLGWKADIDELMAKETTAAIHARLGVKTQLDAWMFMVNEWKAQSREQAERALSQMRWESIDFDELETRLIREAEGVIGAIQTKSNSKSDSGRLAKKLDEVAAAVNELASLRAEPVKGRSRGLKGRAKVGDEHARWQEVQKKLLAMRNARKPYTTIRGLAKQFRCGEGTIAKAIRKSPILKGWQTRGMEEKNSPRATTLNEVVRDTIQSNESQPDTAIRVRDADRALNRLIDQSEPQDQERFRALPPEDRQTLAQLYAEQENERDPSPLIDDAPGKKPRNPKQHNRP